MFSFLKDNTPASDLVYQYLPTSHKFVILNNRQMFLQRRRVTGAIAPGAVKIGVKRGRLKSNFFYRRSNKNYVNLKKCDLKKYGGGFAKKSHIFKKIHCPFRNISKDKAKKIRNSRCIILPAGTLLLWQK